MEGYEVRVLMINFGSKVLTESDFSKTDFPSSSIPSIVVLTLEAFMFICEDAEIKATCYQFNKCNKNRYGIDFRYTVNGREWSVYKIRNHLLHGGACSAEEVKKLDEAIKVASTISRRHLKPNQEILRESCARVDVSKYYKDDNYL